MRLHRFYVSEKIGDKKEITVNSVEQVNQIRRVFRLKISDSIIVFDSSGYDYECRIEDFGKDFIELSIISTNKSRYMPPRDIYLCAAVVKKDTFEWIVEKATELGVTHIIPIMAERSEKKSLNMGRLKKIAIEASEQSGRGNVPVIHNIMTLKEVLRFFEEKENIELIAFHTEDDDDSSATQEGVFIFSPKRKFGLEDSQHASFGFGEKMNTPSCVADEVGETVPARSDAVFIGPEGGWSKNEILVFHENGAKICCLGQQVLRVETAVISALSLVVFGK